ncbi:MAG TPA: zinc-ribbon domain-containing protein [Blastocatellia bacterium]|nr:zinc-ribbon domain-containing protein [Blastocatellia bacterium]
MDITPVKEVRFGEWISEGFNMFTAQWKGWVVLALGLFCSVALPTIVYTGFVYAAMIASAVGQASSRTPSAAEPISAFLIIGGFFLLALVMLPLAAVLIGGMHNAALKQVRGGQVEFKDLFSVRDRFLPLVGALLLYGVLVEIGSLLCVIPGLIVAGLLFFIIPLIIDRNLGVIDAMKTSVEMTKPNLLMFTLFALVVHLISGVGAIACYVGLLATLPLTFTMTAVTYRDCFGLEGAAKLPPAQPWGAATYSPPVLEATRPYSPPPQAPQPQAGTVCPNCQASLPATAKFCFRCGAPAPGK